MNHAELHGIEKPGRYVGNEINAYHKDFDQVSTRVALAFPDVYEVGLSHLGLQLLYHTLNQLEDVLADRVYAPWLDFEKRLRSRGERLRSVESGQPLGDFDFIGFSLQYELSYTNILTILNLAGIPFESVDRGVEHPLIIGGGPCAFNPEPLADLFDFLILGEAEQVFVEVLNAHRNWKHSRGNKQELLKEISTIPGVYVPSLFRVHHLSDGRIADIEAVSSQYPQVRKRLIVDLDADSPIPERPLVPLLEIVHNRLGIEIARGCTRGCRFCQAGFIYRPVRERNPARVLDWAQRALTSSGFEEVSLLSLSTGDYCQIQSLLVALMDRLTSRKIAVSLPSMRVGTLTPELMEAILRVRKTGFTLAPEAGSERLRRVINKGIQDADLLDAAENAFRLGWRLLKLYFMTGLPTETQEDRDALVALCRRVWELAKPTRASINISISTFVPKPHTPFQWAPQIPKEETARRLEELKTRVKRPGMRLKWHAPSHSFLEGVFARGDRRLWPVIRRAWELGARFDAWTEQFRGDAWWQAFSDSGLDPSFYALRERSLEESLPWDHLSPNVEKTFLRAEYERSLEEKPTPDCRWDRCSQCGACDHKTIQPLIHMDAAFSPPSPISAGHSQAPRHFLYRLEYAKLDTARFFGQLEMAQIFERTLRRARLPVAFTAGFHPHIKLSFAGALPVGMESIVEEVTLTLVDLLDPESIAAAMNAHLPQGLRVLGVTRVDRRLHSNEERRVTYRISRMSPWLARTVLQEWCSHRSDALQKKTKKGVVRTPLGSVLLDVRQADGTTLEMDLRETERLCFRPAAILEHFSGDSSDSVRACRFCKIAVTTFDRDERSGSGHTEAMSCTM